VKLAQLTVPEVVSFRDKLRAKKCSPAMIKRVVGDLGSMLAYAQERGPVAQNVVRSLSGDDGAELAAAEKTLVG